MDTPILNIETIGCKNYGGNDVITWCIPSLTFNSNKWFGLFKKTIYIPMLFENEDQIKEIFKYYSDLKFRLISLVESEYSYNDKREWSGEYDFSFFKRFKYMCKCSLLSDKFDVEYVIKYRNHDINLTIRGMYFSYFSMADKPNIFDMVINRDRMIYELQTHYTTLPIFNNFSVWSVKDSWDKKFKTIEDAMKFIDMQCDDKEAFDNKLNSQYSMKSFKIIEN